MGRAKIEIKKIESKNGRQVTFCKRRAGVIKKAHELSVLCDAEVAVIMFSDSGKLYEFASSSMLQVLSRYNKYLETSETSILEPDAENNNSDEMAAIKERFAQLQRKHMQLLGNDCNGLDVNDLEQLIKLFDDGLLSVKDRKEEMLMHQLEQGSMEEECVMLENKNLQEVDELRSCSPTSSLLVSNYPEYGQEKKLLPETRGAKSPETECKGGAENVDLLNALQLGTTFHIQRKKRTFTYSAGKEPEQEIAEKGSHSGTSENQIACDSCPCGFV